MTILSYVLRMVFESKFGGPWIALIYLDLKLGHAHGRTCLRLVRRLGRDIGVSITPHNLADQFKVMFLMEHLDPRDPRWRASAKSHLPQRCFALAPNEVKIQ